MIEIINSVDLFFDKSPEANISGACAQPIRSHEKLKGLCKIRWAERHSCLETFAELYEHVITCLDAMVNPHVYPEVHGNSWNWDSDSKTTAHGLKTSQKLFEGFVS